MSLRVAAVFVVCALWLGSGLAALRLGEGYLDPVGKVTAQDEAVYSHAAIRMARTSDWGTPYFLGRFFLYKPPLVYWLSGLSVKILGVSAWALRLPAALAGAAVLALVFAWVAREAGWWRGLLAAGLLACCPLFAGLARRNLTDAPLCLGIVLFCWLLGSRRAFPALAMAGCVAWCILAKSTAGLVPLMIAAAWWWFGRPAVRTLLVSAAAGFVLAAPWFVYQWWLHPRWFVAEFIGVELLAFGTSAPPQTSAETTVAFYASRLQWSAMAVLLPLAFAVPGWWRALRHRDGWAWLMACWVAVMFAAIAGYQYRNATYLLPALPPLAMVAARYAHPGAAVVGVALAWFVAARETAPSSPNAVAALAERYAAMGRSGRELIIVGAEDNFAASTLPIAKLRYALPGTGQPARGFALDFAQMGVVVSVGDFNNPGALEIYRPRLREWGLPDDSALATVIAWPDAAALAALIRGNPGRDFLVPVSSAPEPPGDSGHRVERDAVGNRLLLAR